MKLNQSIFSSSFFLLVGVAGCTTTVTTGGSTCSLDAAAGCNANASGYSCTGADTPERTDTNLTCSAGTAGPAGAILYCCVDVVFNPSTCGANATVAGCLAPSIGFSCTGANRPEQTDSSLACSAGVSRASGSTDYCCNTAGTAPGSCVADANVACATPGATGYTCSSGVAPPQSLSCGAGAPESGGAVGYCCTPASSLAACAQDANVSCTTAGSTGYTCPSGVTPPSSLSCGAGVPEGGGAAGYCCTTATTVAACAQDTSVTCTAGTAGYTCPSGMTPPSPLHCGAGVPESASADGYCCTTGTSVSSTCAPSGAVACTSGFTGYSCSGQDTPWEATPSLICEPAASIGAGSYCCVTSANSCLQAPNLIDCPSGYYGVSCSGADTAMNANSALLLCASDPNGGAMDFCCTAK